MKNLENNLKKFREIEPDEKFWHISKSILLNKIEKDLSSNKKQRLSFESFAFDFVAFTKTVLPGWKFASVAMSVLVVLSGTFIGAQAAMPGTTIGNILYPVKTQIIEPTELALAKDIVEKANISLKHASNRLEEINYLIDNQKEDQIGKVTDNMQRSLAQASDNLQSMKDENVKPEELLALAKSINKNSDQTLSSLKDKVSTKNPEAVAALIRSTQKLNTAALEIMIKSNPDKELVNKSLSNQINLQIEAVKVLDDKINSGKQTLDKTNELSNNVLDKALNSEQETVNPIANISKEQVEFSINSVKEVADPQEISLLIEKSKQLLDEGKIEEAYSTMIKVGFYINLADKTLDAENYESKLQELEKSINQAQVKSVTEQKSQ